MLCLFLINIDFKDFFKICCVKIKLGPYKKNIYMVRLNKIYECLITNCLKKTNQIIITFKNTIPKRAIASVKAKPNIAYVNNESVTSGFSAIARQRAPNKFPIPTPDPAKDF